MQGTHATGFPTVLVLWRQKVFRALRSATWGVAPRPHKLSEESLIKDFIRLLSRNLLITYPTDTRCPKR